MKKQPLLVITFDDFFPSDFEVVYPIMRRLGIVGTSYVNTVDHLQRNPLRKGMDFWDAIKTMRDSGWAIESHTHTHTNVDILTETQMTADMTDQDDYFKAQGLGIPRHLALPYGMSSPSSLAIIKTYRTTIRGTEEGLEDWDRTDFHMLKARSMDMHTEDDLEFHKSQVLDAIANNKILITYSHEQTATGEETNWTGKIELFKAFLEWAVTQPIKIVTIDQMYQMVKPYKLGFLSSFSNLSLFNFLYDNVNVEYNNNILSSSGKTRTYHSCFLPENVYEVSFKPLLIENDVVLILGGTSERWTGIRITTSGIDYLIEYPDSGNSPIFNIDSTSKYAGTILATDVIKVSYNLDKYKIYVNDVLVYTLDRALFTNPDAKGFKVNNRLGFVLQKPIDESSGLVEITDVKGISNQTAK